MPVGVALVGFFFSVSEDLKTWSKRKLITEVELPFSYQCGDPNPVGYPSVVDHGSRSRNFATSGRNPYLYFTRYHYRDCVQSLNRDLIRVPLRLSK